MKRKEFIFIAAILLIAFVIITIVKYRGNSGPGGSLTRVAKSNSSQTFWTYYNRATEYRLHGNADSSITAYKDALNLNPNHEDALYYMGNMYLKANNPGKALETWQKLIVLNPQSERTYNQLGNLYFCMNHPDYFHPGKSKLYFKHAAGLNQETLNPGLRLGEIAVYQDSTNKALGIFNKLSMMDQKNVEIFFLTGYLYWKSGDGQDAIKDLQRTFELGLPVISNSEDEHTGKSAKKASGGNNRQCDLFMNWMSRNINAAKKHDISHEMPEFYKEFDQYLVVMRKRLNID